MTTDGYALSGIDDVTGPKRRFPVYRIPPEVEENFVPTIEDAISRKMVESAFSAEEFVANLKTWAKRNRVGVSGSFNERPYQDGAWRIAETTPDRSSAGALREKDLKFGPTAREAARPARERKPCSKRAGPDDADPNDRSKMCEEGGAQ